MTPLELLVISIVVALGGPVAFGLWLRWMNWVAEHIMPGRRTYPE